VQRTFDPLPTNDPFAHGLAEIMADAGRNEGTPGLSATRWYRSTRTRTAHRDASGGERDDPGDHARRRAARARERGGAKR
jgi:hypothetical protein